MLTFTSEFFKLIFSYQFRKINRKANEDTEAGQHTSKEADTLLSSNEDHVDTETNKSTNAQTSESVNIETNESVNAERNAPRVTQNITVVQNATAMHDMAALHQKLDSWRSREFIELPKSVKESILENSSKYSK